MEIQVKKDRKKIIFIAVIVLLCLIAAAVFAMAANSDERQLAHQLELGQKYLDEMDYEQAIVAYEAAIAIDPKCVDAYLGMTEAYIGLEDMEMAIVVLEEGHELTEDEEIQKKLDELHNKMVDKESIKVEESIARESIQEEELPYFELAFSPEDFTIAGYSVMDGNHIGNIMETAATVMPDGDDIRTTEYIGWSYYSDNENHLAFSYQGEGWGAENPVQCVESDLGVTFYIWPSSNWGKVPVKECSLFKFKVIPDETSYEEAVDILGIKQIVELSEEAKERGEGEEFLFESQYGSCRGYFWVTKSDGIRNSLNIEIDEGNWNFGIEFHDNKLDTVKITKGNT